MGATNERLEKHSSFRLTSTDVRFTFLDISCARQMVRMGSCRANILKDGCDACLSTILHLNVPVVNLVHRSRHSVGVVHMVGTYFSDLKFGKSQDLFVCQRCAAGRSRTMPPALGSLTVEWQQCVPPPA